jgi:hypothetical protein
VFVFRVWVKPVFPLCMRLEEAILLPAIVKCEIALRSWGSLMGGWVSEFEDLVIENRTWVNEIISWVKELGG